MRTTRPYIVALVVFGVAAFLPLMLSKYYLHMAILVLLWAFLATAWNILGGYGGQHSLGNGLFMGIGAYGAAYLVLTWNISPWLSMGIFFVVAGLAGAFVGYLTFRYGLKGAYFALVTIALTEAAVYVTSNWAALGANNGLSLPIAQRNNFAMLQFTSETGYFYVILVLTLLIMVFTIWLASRRFGYRLISVRENEDAAEALGVGTMSTKMWAIMLSAALTAVGGVFYIVLYNYVNPRSVFGEAVSVQILLYAIVGGLGTVWGPLVGAAILVPVAEIVRGSSLGQQLQGAYLLTYGVILVLTMLFMPTGIVGVAKSIRRRLGGRAPEGPPAGVTPGEPQTELSEQDGAAL
jgi:branched-chain amino acid transport system permease protein